MIVRSASLIPLAEPLGISCTANGCPLTGGLLNEERGPDHVRVDPKLWPDLGEFRRLSKPFSSHPNPYILPQQTTVTTYCVDIDPHAPCIYEWLSKPFGRTACTYHTMWVNHTEIRCNGTLLEREPGAKITSIKLARFP